MITALVILVLILLNGVFVAAEFAIIGVPRSTVERRATEGSVHAAAVLAVLRDPRQQNRYIATAQLGITFASLGLGMYGEHALAVAIAPLLARMGVDHWVGVHAVASVISVAILTYFHIVVGEMIPKTFALQRAESTALGLSTPMRWLKWLMLPLVIVFNAIGNALLRLVGIRRGGSATPNTAEDLRFIVEESVAEGELEEEAGQVLLELFQFGERTAAEVMMPRVRVLGIPLGAAPAELRQLLSRPRHARYPVYRRDLDEIAGMVLIRDVLGALQRDAALTEDLVRPVPFVPTTARLDTILTLMRREKTQLVVVMDEHGGTAGIVSMEDLFEEIVGEIADGWSGPDPVHRDGAEVRALGLARLDEVGEEIGADLSHEEVDSVSGLILTLLNRPAVVGDVVEHRGYRFRVVSIDGRGIEEAAVVPVEPPPE